MDGNPSTLTDEEEAAASKFRTLLKVGVPPATVRREMERAGVAPKVVAALVGDEASSDDERAAEPRSRSDPEESVPAPCPPTDFEGWGASVDPRNPTLAWEATLKRALPPVEIVDVANDGDAPVHAGGRPRPEGHSRWVCVSDTHGAQGRMTSPIPEGDVLIHAGDFSRMGGTTEVKKFCEWMRSLPHTHKIVIAGNHDVTMEENFDVAGFGKAFGISDKGHGSATARELVRSCDAFTYLEDSAVEVLGYKVYGSPWQPEFCNWAFNLPRGPACAEKWRRIPPDTDVLVTHGPPAGHGDLCASGLRAGCVDLLAEVLTRVRPGYHVFGHIHEGYGCTRMGDTLFLNASTCTFHYRPSNPPLVFDLPRRSKK